MVTVDNLRSALSQLKSGDSVALQIERPPAPAVGVTHTVYPVPQELKSALFVELLKQPQYQPYNVNEEVLSIFAGTRGFLDDVPVKDVPKFETALLKHFVDRAPFPRGGMIGVDRIERAPLVA